MQVDVGYRVHKTFPVDNNDGNDDEYDDDDDDDDDNDDVDNDNDIHRHSNSPCMQAKVCEWHFTVIPFHSQ